MVHFKQFKEYIRLTVTIQTFFPPKLFLKMGLANLLGLTPQARPGGFFSNVSAVSRSTPGYGNRSQNTRVVSGSYSMGKYDSMYGPRRHLAKGYYGKMLYGGRKRRAVAFARGGRRYPRGGAPAINQYILQRTGGGELKWRGVVMSAPVTSNATVPPDIFTDDANLAAVWNIPNGTGDQARIGQVVYMKSLSLRYRITHTVNPSTTAVPHQVRMVLVYDTSANGVAVSFNDIFDDNANNTVWNFKNVEQAKRFKILHDKVFLFNPIGGAYNGTDDVWAFPERLGSVYWKAKGGKGLALHYSGTSGVIAQRTRGNFLFFFATDTTSMSVDKCVIRMRFTDS